jgi:gp178
MNKQELFERISHLPSDCSRPRPMIDKLTALELIKLLDEPQKVQVPQFVADWYEANKDDFEGNLFRCIDRMPDLFSGEELSDFEEWIVDGHTKPFQILVNMHQFGYTVEKEKRYFVRVKGVYFNNCLIFEKRNKTWFFSSIYEIDHQRGHHTRKELEEAGFGEVFDSPLFEVEEVEE